MRLAPLFVLLAANMLGNSAWAADLPSGGVVAAGSASITAGANSLVVNQSSARAIINWNNFSVGTGASVQFVQPGASSAVLNRVVTANPSLLNGPVTANGQVFLVNPNGIIVGASGRIDAAGIFLSTGNIADADFLSGNIRFDPPPAETPIVISGALNAIDTIELRASSVDCASCTVKSQDHSIFVTDSFFVTGSIFATNSSSITAGSIVVTGSPPSGGTSAPTGTSYGGVTLFSGSSPGAGIIAVSDSSPGAATIALTGWSPATLTVSGSSSSGGTLALTGSAAGGVLVLAGGPRSVLPYIRRLIQLAGGSIALRGATMSPLSQGPLPLSAPPAAPNVQAAPAPGATTGKGSFASTTGGMVDGAVTLRVSLVDASPIVLH